MPQVKIDHIVSFSSEDPGRPAKSLCSSGVGVGWRSSVSERTSSVVCGLQRAVHIFSITVGVVNVALIEVLVGRSAQPDHYEVLVPRSVVIPPLESRKGGGGERVRTWGGDLLTKETTGQLWDRIKLVCSQPYDKQAQFGISFVHVFSPETGGNVTSAGGQDVREVGDIAGVGGLDSEEEEFTPGELWRRHTAVSSNNTHTNTDAQIRQATSQALKNVLPDTPCLVKTNLNKEKRTSHSHTSEKQGQRDRDNLMYDSDDDKPNEKIDNAVSKHREEKDRDKKHKDQTSTSAKDKQHKEKSSTSAKDRQHKDQSSTSDKDRQSSIKETENKSERDRKDKERHKEKENQIKIGNEKREGSRSVDLKRTDMKRRSEDRSSGSSKDRDNQRKRIKIEESKIKTGPDGNGGLPLSGVVFTISGYVHPRRGVLRGGATSLGGAYRPDVTDDVTHILAAYHNTPKVRAAAAGTVVVLGEWVDECVRRGDRVDPGPYLTDPAHRTKHTDTPGPKPRPARRRSPSSGSDTDDEIQRVLHRGGTAPSTSTGGAEAQESEIRSGGTQQEGSEDTLDGAQQDEEDVAEATGDNVKKRNDWSSDDSAAGDTEGEEEETEALGSGKKIEGGKGELPDLLEGAVVKVRGGNTDLLERYITAYGGTIAHEQSSEEDADVYVCGAGGVRPSWVWDLHTNKELPHPEPYLIHD